MSALLFVLECLGQSDTAPAYNASLHFREVVALAKQKINERDLLPFRLVLDLVGESACLELFKADPVPVVPLP